MELKEFLEELNFNKEEIEVITKEGAEKDAITTKINEWHTRYGNALITSPEVEKRFREQLAPNLLAEAKKKERKEINTIFSLGLTNKQMDEMTKEQWAETLSTVLKKSDDDQVKELKERFDKKTQEYIDLEDSFEKTKSEIEKTWKSKYSSKVAKAKISDFLSTLENTVIDKSELPDIIEAKRAKEGLQIEVDDNDNIILTKDGNRLFNNNKPVEVDEWLKGLTTPYITKTPAAPGTKIAGVAGVENQDIQKSKRALELEAKLQPAQV